MKGVVTTALCTSTEDDILVRGRSVPRELIGRVTFTEMMFFQILGRDPTRAQTVMLDGCLVALMEHGLTPTAISARLTYSSAPEAMQGAVAAGLLSVGSLFVGTMEDCARLLERLVGAADMRCAGLVGHIHEEQQRPALRALWRAAEHAVPYAPPSEEDR